MNPQLRNAAVRACIALVLVLVWVTWFDGPPWAWAFLAIYIAFTFGFAIFITRRMAALAQKLEGKE